MRTRINDLTELRAEILRLKQLKVEQEAYLKDQSSLLKEKISKPVNFVKRVVSVFQGNTGIDDISGKTTGSNKFEPDLITHGLKIGLPFLMSRVFLRRAGYLKRIFVSVASTQAAGLINKERIQGGIQKLISFITPNKKSTKKSGIPRPVKSLVKKSN